MSRRAVHRISPILLLVLGGLSACSGSTPVAPDPDPDPVPVATVEVTPDSASIEVGTTRAFSAQSLSATGASLTGRTPSWSTMDPSVATVDAASGVVTGVAEGSTVVSATVEGIEGTGIVVVTAAPVASVGISPDTLHLDVADTASFTAATLDAAGDTLVGPEVRWSSLDTGVATVDSMAGLVTAVGAGTTSIVAVSQSVADTAVVVVTDNSVPAGFTMVWKTNAPDTVWSNPDNWMPAGPPTAADSVLIQAGTNQPSLLADGVVGTMTVQTGARVALGGWTLTVSGDVQAGGAGVTGAGSVTLEGSGTVSGTLPTLTVTGSYTLAGAMSVTGSVSINGSGSLAIGAETLSVTGNLSTSNTGVIVMTDAAGVLDVDGDVSFVGGTTHGMLTAGTLRVAGDFVQQAGGTFAAFAATDAHLVVLDGASPQTVSFSSSGTADGSSRFANFEIAGADVSIPGDVTIIGDASVTSTASVTGSGTIDVLGDLTTVAGSNVATTGVALGGAMSIAGTFAPGTTEFFGTAQVIQPGLDYANLTVSGSAALSGATSVSGSVSINGSGSLTIGAETLSVTGNLSTSSTGVIVMTDAAGVLDVDGDVSFVGGTTHGMLTAGTLRVAGDFVQQAGGTFAAFAATDAHLVVLDGASPQTVSFSSSGTADGSSRFANFEIAGADVSIPGDVTIIGDASVTSTASVTGSGTIDVLGDLTTVAGSNVATTGVALGGAMSIAGTFAPGTTEFFGTAQVIQPGLDYANLTVSGSAELSGATSVTGSVSINGSGSLTIGAETLSVTGNLSTSNTGVIVMTDAAGVLDVDGDVSFVGGTTHGMLTAGTLRVAGDFVQQAGGTFAAFAATDAHLVVLDGASPQTVSFSSSGTADGSSRFANFEIAGADVSFSTDLTIIGDVLLTGWMTLDDPRTLDIISDLVMEAGATLTNNGTINVGGSCTDNGATVTGSGGGNQACVIP